MPYFITDSISLSSGRVFIDDDLKNIGNLTIGQRVSIVIGMSQVPDVHLACPPHFSVRIVVPLLD